MLGPDRHDDTAFSSFSLFLIVSYLVSIKYLDTVTIPMYLEL